MAGWEAALGIAIALGITIFIVIMILCVYGGRKLEDSIDAKMDKKLAAKRDADERGILVGAGEEKEKIGIIISPLEGFLTENDDFWKIINSELGYSTEYEPLIDNYSSEEPNYSKLIRSITSKWKRAMRDSPTKLDRRFFNDFYQKYLRIREGAIKFIEYCQENYDYYVISEAPWEFCLLAQEELGFYHYYATTIFAFDRNDELDEVIAHKYGFQTEKIVERIIKQSQFSARETIVLSNIGRDINMVNQAVFGIIIGRNLPISDTETAPNPNLISLPTLDFEELKIKLDQITETIKQANALSAEEK
jgi:phosphoserine phosphatase